MEIKQISIGCDHAGFDYKEDIITLIEALGVKVIDHGTYSKDSVDYPDFVHPTCKDVIENKSAFGVILCGSGNGVNMTANKYQSIRSALCWTSEIAALARQHNDANIVAIPVRFIKKSIALDIIKIFLTSKFEGGRHQRRVNKIACC